MTAPVWVTPSGSLGTIPEGVFYQVPLMATSSPDTVYYQVIAGQLPAGVQINENGLLSGNPLSVATTQGVPAPVARDTTSKFAVRAYTTVGGNPADPIKSLADRTFTLTISGQNTVEWVTPAGLIGTYFSGVQITDLQLQYFNPDIYAVEVVTLIAGQLPPGLSLSTSGIISGYVIPDTNSSATNTDYQFTLRVSNGVSSDIRTFDILVYALNTMTADNTYITADNTYITADTSPPIPPIITTPTGSIGEIRSDNFFAFRFTALDFNYNAVEFVIDGEIPGLTLDPTSGWLYGYIPFQGILSTVYPFTVQVFETANPSVTSLVYNYSLTIMGPVNSDVIWLTPSYLGAIDNGDTSTFYVAAVNVAGLALSYQLLSGSDSRLPQGLQLLPSGHIAGRVSFDTFALDSGTTTFDTKANPHYNPNNNPTIGINQPTTFDMVCTFTVNATSVNGLVNVNKTFSIKVIRRYNEPYDNLYIQAMPPQNDRDLIASLVQDISIFPPDLIYRADDPNFGVSRKVIYNHAYGLTAATYDDYVASLNLNHYWKNLVLGEIKTAQALDDSGNVIYEVVYSQVIDNLVNNQGTSVGKSVNLPFEIRDNIQIVYPNSLVGMRTQVIDVVGQVSNVLPRWMLSKQANGSVLGFTTAWVIAYTNPGQSGQIAYNIQSQFGVQLNLVDFEVDRYELDNLLTKNWDREEQHWIPQPPSLTTFDITGVTAQWINNSSQVVQWSNTTFDDFISTWTTATPPGTVFDGNSLQFIAPVDMYSNTQIYDKYLVFPKQNILE
jgi:hypothetical protein